MQVHLLTSTERRLKVARDVIDLGLPHRLVCISGVPPARAGVPDLPVSRDKKIYARSIDDVTPIWTTRAYGFL